MLYTLSNSRHKCFIIVVMKQEFKGDENKSLDNLVAVHYSVTLEQISIVYRLFKFWPWVITRSSVWPC